MEEIIKPHSFESAKQHIQTFASSTTTNTDLSKVDTSGGLFGWFDHNVTGAELNKVTGQVQEHLIRINDLQKSFISEFGQVYNALESLDKEYIPAILSAVKGAEESSNQAKQASDKAHKAQTDINKTIEAQKKVIAILSEHKKKLDSFKHLENIDTIWKDLKTVQTDISSSKSKIDSLKKEIEKEKKELKELSVISSESMERIESRVGSIESDLGSIKSQEHINEVDDLWEKMSKNYVDIQNVITKLDDMLEKIGFCEQQNHSLSKSIADILAYEHLRDIDVIWADVHENKMSIASNLEQIVELNHSSNNLQQSLDELLEYKSLISKQKHFLDIDEIYDSDAENQDKIRYLIEYTDRLDNTVKNQQEIQDDNYKKSIEALEKLTSKIKIAYYVAGGAVGIAVLELILNLLGVM